MVLQKAGLTYDSRYIVIPRFYLEWKLEKDDLIEAATVHKELDGAITIEVKEKSIVGYYIDNGKNYALVNDGSSLVIDSTMLDTIVNYRSWTALRLRSGKSLPKALAENRRWRIPLCRYRKWFRMKHHMTSIW